MVNLNKWEKIDLLEVRMGDELKRVEMISGTDTGVIRGTVFDIVDNGYRLSVRVTRLGDTHALVREHGRTAPDGVFLYRKRKTAPEFVFPDKPGAVVVGYRKRADGLKGTKELFTFDGKFWHSLRSGGLYRATVAQRYEGFLILSAGVTL